LTDHTTIEHFLVAVEPGFVDFLLKIDLTTFFFHMGVVTERGGDLLFDSLGLFDLFPCQILSLYLGRVGLIMVGALWFVLKLVKFLLFL
jgi:hypothetical protein